MPVDTSIYGNLLRPASSLADNVAALDQADLQRTQLAGARLNLIGQQQQQADQQALRSLYQRPDFDPSTPAGLMEIGRISPSAYASARKAQLDGDKTKAETKHLAAQTANQQSTADKNLFETARKKLELGTSIVTSANTPAEAQAKFQQAVALGLMTPEEAAQKVQEVPADPAGFDGWKKSSALALLSASERINAAQREAEAAETARHNRETEANTRRGQDQVNQRAQDALSKPFEVTGPSGTPILVQQDKKGVLRQVEGFSPKAKPAKDVPQTVVTSFAENNTALDKIDAAIASVRENGGAMGGKNYLPDALTQRMDPEGVKTRAQVADIGSLKIHDRSGAAVSVSEDARLKPFVPLATDRPDVAITKLENLKNEYLGKNQGVADYYTPEAGFKPLPARKGLPQNVPTSAAAAPSIDMAAVQAEIERRKRGGR